jgi:hypothetical protein
VTSALLCATLPGGPLERVVGGATPKEARSRGASFWLDDQRLLVHFDGVYRLVDFGAGTIAKIVGLPDARVVTPLAGGHKFVLDRGVEGGVGVTVVDLDARALTSGPAGEYEVQAVPGNDRKMILHRRERFPKGAPQPFFWAET